MAKYKLRAEVIAPLTSAGIIDTDGYMELNIPLREQGQTERLFKLRWHSTNECIQSNNRVAMRALRHTQAPASKVNGTWRIIDPAESFFSELPDSDATPAKTVGTSHGVELLSRHERKLIRKYKTEHSITLPKLNQIPRNDVDGYLIAAQAHFGLLS